MKERLEKLYYKLPEKQFNGLLNNLKNNTNTLHFFEYTKQDYFYLHDEESNEVIVKLHKDQWEFDSIVDNLSDFSQKQILSSFLISEIEATNKIENIKSTRHDIFSILNNYSKDKDKRIVSITNSYLLMLSNADEKINSMGKIKYFYDVMMMNALDKEDELDGKIFRKNNVEINDGFKGIHKGFYPEELIIKGMNEFLDLYNNPRIDIYERAILSHFLIETIHPFYDGNGRFGRLLFSLLIYNRTNSLLSFVISCATNNNKSKYYKLLKETRSVHEFGCLNYFFVELANIIHNYNQTIIKDIKNKKDLIDKLTNKLPFSKTENKIYKILVEASVLSDFGISNNEIMKNINVSKRTVINTTNKFKKLGILIDTKINKNIYHKIKI